jgi:hypothetical protein
MTGIIDNIRKQSDFCVKVLMDSISTYRKFNTPILFVIFNRPQTTRHVFASIRAIKPPRLYIAADGPRPYVAEDPEKCAATRKVIEQVDWDCEVKKLFNDVNQNCGVTPSNAFTWFFEHEEEGIILEDDCLPSESFFWFCQELLERYRDDSRIMHIGGNNFLKGWQRDNDYSYYFSRSGHIWGWATWKRAWKLFDFNMNLYEKVKDQGFFNNFFLNPVEKIYRLRKFEKTVAKRGYIDWWDYQWDFARFINSGLAIVPQKNLVRNLGFGINATHTTNSRNMNASLQTNELEFPLRHPPFIVRDVQSDKRYFTNLMTDALRSKIGI